MMRMMIIRIIMEMVIMKSNDDDDDDNTIELENEEIRNKITTAATTI